VAAVRASRLWTRGRTGGGRAAGLDAIPHAVLGCSASSSQTALACAAETLAQDCLKATRNPPHGQLTDHARAAALWDFFFFFFPVLAPSYDGRRARSSGTPLGRCNPEWRARLDQFGAPRSTMPFYASVRFFSRVESCARWLQRAPVGIMNASDSSYLHDMCGESSAACDGK